MIDSVPPAFFIVVAAAFGAIVGSFLNVCIYRLPIEKSIVWPGSACMSCGRELSWFENIPVFAWLARHVDEEELRRVFNLGIGWCAVVAEPAAGETVIGRIR